VTIQPENLPDDIDTLKRIIATMVQEAVASQVEIEKLRFELARLKRAQFGRSSEKLEQTVAQLELAIETLEEDSAEQRASRSPAFTELVEQALDAKKPARRPLPEHLPREIIVHPVACTCPSCGGSLRKIGEDVTETLDYVPVRFKVVWHIREKFSRRACDTRGPGTGAAPCNCPRARWSEPPRSYPGLEV